MPGDLSVSAARPIGAPAAASGLHIVERAVPDASYHALVANGVSPVLARVYASRGVSLAGDLDYQLARLAPPVALPGIEAAAKLVGETLVRGALIAIAGDYDADGATASAILHDALTGFGGQAPLCLIPSRFRDGYGLSPALVDAAHAAGARLIITVDNGITALDAIDHARALGIPVVVTDHHLPATVDGAVRLPAAAAIIDPHLAADGGGEQRNTCGAGLAFYLAAAVRVWLRWRGHPGGHARLDGLLDLVALGTVADVVPLDRNNRVLVSQGLARIRRSARPGIAALFTVGGRDLGAATCEDLGFVVGPRLNAAGRLASMDLGVRLLIERDPEQAMEMARELDRLNHERRTIETSSVDEVLAGLPEAGAGPTDRALAFFGPQWHEGVVGLIASRLRERFHRPVVALCLAQDGTVKGSGRSIAGLHLRDALARIDASHPGLMLRFGGHAMAAGLSLAPERVEAFRSAFAGLAGAMVPEESLQPVAWSDGDIPGGDLTIDLAAALRDGGPWGNGFPAPAFHGTFMVRNFQILKGAHRSLTLEKDGRVFRAIQFRNAEPPADTLTCTYRPQINDWNGEQRLQLMIEGVP